MALVFCLGDFLRLRALALLLASPPRRNHYSFRWNLPWNFSTTRPCQRGNSSEME